MSGNKQTVEGIVQSKLSGKGSKSEHQGYYLVTANREFLLRKKDQNPFQQTGFKKFEGKRVRCTGTNDDYVFFVDEIASI